MVGHGDDDPEDAGGVVAVDADEDFHVAAAVAAAAAAAGGLAEWEGGGDGGADGGFGVFGSGGTVVGGSEQGCF